MSDKGLLELAKRDLTMAGLALNLDTDELYLNSAAYSTQQSLEKVLKYLINMKGEDYPRTHQIEILLDTCKGLDINYPEYLNSMSYTISDWATKTRYNVNYRTTRQAVDLILNEVKEWIEIIEGGK